MHGADAIVNVMKTEELEFLSRFTEGSTMAIYDAIHSAGMGIPFCRHGRGAADIADGFARITTRTGMKTDTAVGRHMEGPMLCWTTAALALGGCGN